MAEVGWCHQCGTFQLLEDAPCLVAFDGSEPEPCCVVCGTDEPWQFAVMPMPASVTVCAEQRHESWSPIPCEVCGRGEVGDLHV